MSRVESNRNVYVGHRYVPKIMGEWNKQNEYEGLSIVTHQGASYTSKKRVPVGIDILNKEFWSLTGNYNAQVEYYRDETERVAEDLLLKSDKTYVDTELGKKSDKTYVDTELGKKSDKTYVDTELGKKANKTYVDTELGKKSDDIENINLKISKINGVFINDFERNSNETDDMGRFQRAINSLNKGQRLIITDDMEYVFKFKEGSTILNPTRVEIWTDNIEIIGIGKPTIKMVGLTKEYLDSIDDYASSGRDIFTAFSFINTDNPVVKNIKIVGEHALKTRFRYQSPRSIAIAFKGVKGGLIEDVIGDSIYGNVVNMTNSYEDYDGSYRECYNNKILNSQAFNCLENGFNFMGTNHDSFASNLYATGCSSGLETACDGLTVSDCIFDGNRGSGAGFSGFNTVVSNVLAINSTGEEGIDNGYGFIITGGNDYTFSNCKATNNKGNGVYVYPGITNVEFSDIDFSNSGERNLYKINVYVTGTEDRKIKNVSFRDCKINNTDSFIISANHTDNLKITDCYGKSEKTSVIINSSSVNSKVYNNDFNTPVSMQDVTGINYNNGSYKIVERSSIPTTGKWSYNDKIINNAPGLGSWLEVLCVQGGDFSTEQKPLFNIVKQNGYVNNISNPPTFIGQQALTFGSNPKSYVAVGTDSVEDWLQTGGV